MAGSNFSINWPSDSRPASITTPFNTTTGALAITGLLLLSLALGVIDTLQGTATQTYSFDLAGPTGATNAIALGNLGVFLAGAVGSIASGVALDRLGVASPFILSAVTVAIAATCLVLGGAHARRERPAPHVAPSFRRSMTSGFVTGTQ